MLALFSFLATSIAAEPTTAFEPPFRVRDAKGLIDVEVGHAVPLFVDFNADGLADLLVGQFGGGKLRVYKNRGALGQPKFEGFTWFGAGGKEGVIPEQKAISSRLEKLTAKHSSHGFVWVYLRKAVSAIEQLPRSG